MNRTRSSMIFTKGFTLIGVLAFVIGLFVFVMWNVLLANLWIEMPRMASSSRCMNRLRRHSQELKMFHAEFGMYPPINGRGEHVKTRNWGRYIQRARPTGSEELVFEEVPEGQENKDYSDELFFCPVVGRFDPDDPQEKGDYRWPNNVCPPSYPDTIQSGEDRFTEQFPGKAPIVADRLPASDAANGNHGDRSSQHNVLLFDGSAERVGADSSSWKEASCFAEGGNQ